MSCFMSLDRRAFLTAGAALGTSALCGSAARASTPIAVYLNVELIAVDHKPVSGEQELYSLLPEPDAFEQRLIDHIQHGIGFIRVIPRDQAPFDQPVISRVLFATVRADLASSPFGRTPSELVGVTSLFLRKRLGNGDVDYTYVPTPMTIFGTLKDKAALEVALIDAAKQQIDANLIVPVLQAN
jgi:hypothetical protein